MKNELRFTAFLTLLYLLVGMIGVAHHELWLDEAHHWLLARDSASIAELWRNTRLEGHPVLWSLLLYGVSRITPDPLAMQLLHVLIAAAAVFIFAYKAPFSRVFKILFVFGYFMVFEYGMISRNYMLGLCFIFLACTDFARREKMIRICALLAVAVNVHVVFTVIAVPLFAVLCIGYLRETNWNRLILTGTLIFLAGLVLLAIQIKSTEAGWLLDSISDMPWRERLKPGLASLFKALFNMPDFSNPHFWNTNYFTRKCRTAAAILAILVYALPILLFKSRQTLFFMYMALAVAQLFFWVTHRTAVRFDGILFMAVIVGLWIDRHARQDLELTWRRRLYASGKPLVYGLLLIQFAGGMGAYAMDIRSPFTSSQQTANYLKMNDLYRRDIVTVTCDGTMLSAYLERKIWFLCDGGYRSFCRWDAGCTGNITPGRASAMLSDYMATRKNAVFVSYYPIGSTDGNWHRTANFQFRLLARFDAAIVEKSSYYVFELIRP